MATPGEILFDIKELGKTFPLRRKMFRRECVRALESVSFQLTMNQTLGVVGESGSGKSTLIKILTGQMTPTSGTVDFCQRPLPEWLSSNRLSFHRQIQMVFQDPISSLNPKRRIRAQLETPMRLLTDWGKETREARMKEVLDRVHMPEDSLERYPHAFSGGQAQRIAIARAILVKPRILILDEAVSALDVTVQASVLDLIRELRETENLTLLFVSHDLTVIHQVCDDVIVMKDGGIVESGTSGKLFTRPATAYTRTLVESVYR